MSYKVEIIETNNMLEISSSVNEQAPMIDIIQQGSPNISVVHDIALLPSDFNDNTESVIKSFLRSGYGVSLFPSGDYFIVQTSGLQPSGNYSLNGHNHASLDITDFNSSVSGLLPVKNIISGSGISVSSNNSIFTVAVTGQFGLTAEQVDDRVSSLLSSGYGINLSYDDNNNLLTISTVGLQPTGNYSVVGHTHLSSNITDFVSAASGAAPVQTVAGKTGNVILNKNDIGLFNVDNTSDLNKPISSATQNALDSKAPIANPTFTGSVGGITKSMVGLSNVDNTSDINKPISSLTQNALNLKSDVGHVHNSSNITDFVSSVSGLLPVKNIFSGSGISVTSSGADFTVAVTGQFGLTAEQVDDRVSNLLVAGNYINLNYNDSIDSLTISVSGVQPSGNYSIVGHSHTIGDVSGLQNSLDSKQPSGNYSIVGHSHNSSDITNFNTSVSGLLPVKNIANGSYVNISNNSGNFIVSVTGLQPSGNYANAIHNHSSSQITDFNSSVSGLLPITNVLAGTNISVIPSGTSYTISVSGQLGLTSEQVDDRVASLLNAGNGININYNDPLDILTISTTGLQPSGDYANTVHSHVYTDITNFSSGVADNLTTTLLPGSFINLDYNSTLDTLTISTSGLQPSGNYSVVGHSHTSSDITNFNSSVSGLLPTVANSGSNRLLTSTGTTTGVSAQPNLTFNGSLLNVTGSGVFASGLNLSNQTASTIASFDTDKNITSLSTSSYPSLTELSYVKGVTSSLQTQLDLKSNLNSPSFTGTPTVPTATSGTNSNQIASTSFVRTEISNLIASAPSTLDTLNELATALGSDPNFATTVTNNLSGKANLSGSSFTGNITAPTGDFSVLRQNGINVSVSGHAHTSNDISDSTTFGRNILTTSSYANVNKVLWQIPGASGSPPTFTASAGGHYFIPPGLSVVLIINDPLTGSFGDFYRVCNHNSNMNVIIGGVGYSGAGRDIVRIYSILTSSWQTIILNNHTHTSSQITDFNTSVSGLLPVTNILGGTNISVIPSGTSYTVSVSGQLGLTAEEVDDRISSLLVSGSGISLSYNDAGNALTISTTGLQPSGNYAQNNHFHTTSDVSISGTPLSVLDQFIIGRDAGGRLNDAIIYDGGIDSFVINDFNSSVSGLLPVTNILGGTNISVIPSGTSYRVSVSGQLGLTSEEVDDRVAGLLTAGSGINLSYNDSANSLTISVSGLSSSATIGNGTSGVINYDLSQTLNIVGSGSTSVAYNNTSKTITVSSPSLVREYELINSTKSIFTVTGGYALNNLDVYHNGIKLLASGDYSATNGSTFSLIQPAVSGDVVEWLGYSVVPRSQLILGEVRSDYIGDTNYLGRAVAGSSENANVWSIKKYVVNSNGIDIITTTASNVSWTNRLSATYV